MKRLPPETFRLWREALQGVRLADGSERHIDRRLLVETLDLLTAELEKTYAELDGLTAIVDRCKDGPAMAWLDGFADLRDAIYPDTEVARQTRAQRAKLAPSKEEP